MARSTTIWSAALLLASLSSPLPTTAEAMPAPGPQQTPQRPKYYFPRHIKRAIVTNSTQPASTSSSSSSSSTSDAQSRQSRHDFSDLTSWLESLNHNSPHPPSSSTSSLSLSSSSSSLSSAPSSTRPSSTLASSPSSSNSATGTGLTGRTTVVTADVTVIPSPVGTGNQGPGSVPPPNPTSAYTPPPPIPVSSSPSSGSSIVIVVPPPGVGSTGGLPTTYAAPTSSPTPPIAGVPTGGVGPTGNAPPTVVPPTSAGSSPSDSSSSSSSRIGSSGGVPASPLQPSSAVSSSGSDAGKPANPGTGSSGGLPPTIVPPSSSSVAQSSAFIGPVLGPTGSSPSSVIQPTSPGSSAAQSSLASSVSSNTGIPPFIVFPTPSVGLPPVVTSIVGSSGGIPVPVIQPSSVRSNTGASSAGAPTGGVPPVVVPPTLASESLAHQSTSPAGSSVLGPFIIPGGGSSAGIPATIVQPTSALGISLPSTGIFPTATGIAPSLPGVSFASTGSIPIPFVTGPAPLQSALSSIGTGVLPPVPTSVLQSIGSGGQSLLSSIGTGVVPPVIPTTGLLPSVTVQLPSPPTTGISLGVPGVIPTSESIATPSPSQPEVVSSVLSQLSSILAPSVVPPTGSGVIPTSGAGVTYTAPNPTEVTTGLQPGVTPPPLSSLFSQLTSALGALPSEVSSLVSSAAGQLPTTVPNIPGIVSSIASSAGSQIASELSSIAVVPAPTGTTPAASGALSSILSSILSELSTQIPTILPTSSGILPPLPTGTLVTSGTDVIIPHPTGYTSQIPLPSSGVTAPSSAQSTASPVKTGSSGSNVSTNLPGSTNATGGSPVLSTPPSTRPTSVATSGRISTSSEPVLSFTPYPPKPPSTGGQTIKPTATNSDTYYHIPTSIMHEPPNVPSPLPTNANMSSSIARYIQPPQGIPSKPPPNSYLGEIGFKWPLHYMYIIANDGGNQIFEYLPMAICHALNISCDQVTNAGLKAVDTLKENGYITPVAMFWIPQDLNTTLAQQLLNPADSFWHHDNQTVNDLTSLVNNVLPLLGSFPTIGDTTSLVGPAVTTTGRAGGGAMGDDMSASHKVNPTSAGIATGAVLGACAYGAAMFFVARRYRKKKMSHQRTSSVPSTSRYTYGSMTGGIPWMSGGRGPGRLTPGGRDSRGSRGSGSSNGRSVRTAQISAPVMAENSLGWN